MNQYHEFLAVLKAFEEQGVEYILVGGFAVFLHGMRRFTQDLDIFVKMVPQNIEVFRNALHSVFDDSSIEEITLDELKDYPVIRYGTPSGFYIDILTRLGEVAAYEDLEYETILCEGVNVRIATPETLFELKKNTVRPRDKQDAAFLDYLIHRRRNDDPE